MALWGYVVIAAVGIALAGWVILLVVFMLARRDAPPYWDEKAK